MFLCIVVLGEYIGKIYNETNNDLPKNGFKVYLLSSRKQLLTIVLLISKKLVVNKKESPAFTSTVK
jgi:hypothetical protein